MSKDSPSPMTRLLPAIWFVIFASGHAPAEESSAPATPALSLLRQLDEGFVEIFERVAPAVVVIEARKKPGDDTADEEWQRFFFQEGEESGRPPQKEGDRSRLWPLPPPRSEGSGFLIRPDGHILTNFHVVADAEKLEVRLKDGRKFPARLVGADDKTDIAVIKIDGKELPVASFGDSDKLRVGQLVCAIGAPFNQDYSFTCGWVSGKGRTNLIGPSSPAILYEDYIQTDAFINPGNSGGPLFDVEGRVVGMNTLINGIGRGLAFAIPANMLQEVSSQLITVGRMQRPWIGIRMESLQTSPARERVLGVDKGVVVSTIEPNAPAYKSDLRPADVITEVDGVKLGTARELQKEILKKRVGQLLQLTVWRNGTVIRIPITTGELPTDLTRVANPLPKRVRDQSPRDIGLDLRDAEPAGTGALVMKVEPDGLASDAEMQATDMIAEVDGKPVKDAATAMAAITSLRDQQKPVPLTVQRQGKRSLVILSVKK